LRYALLIVGGGLFDFRAPVTKRGDGAYLGHAHRFWGRAGFKFCDGYAMMLKYSASSLAKISEDDSCVTFDRGRLGVRGAMREWSFGTGPR
jgi:hypothetical protein